MEWNLLWARRTSRNLEANDSQTVAMTHARSARHSRTLFVIPPARILLFPISVIVLHHAGPVVFFVHLLLPIILPIALVAVFTRGSIRAPLHGGVERHHSRGRAGLCLVARHAQEDHAREGEHRENQRDPREAAGTAVVLRSADIDKPRLLLVQVILHRERHLIQVVLHRERHGAPKGASARGEW